MASSLAHVSQLPLPQIPGAVTLHMLSFLKYPEYSIFFRTSRSAQGLREQNRHQVERLEFSRIQIFDRAHWKEYYGVEITDQFDPFKIDIFVLRDFLKTYYGPSPIGPGLVKDACLIPTVVPQSVKNQPYCLKLLKELAEKPLKGHTMTMIETQHSSTPILEQYGTIKTEQAVLVVLLKKVVAPFKQWSQESQNSCKSGQVQFLKDLNSRTGFCCETEPDALSQITNVFAHHVLTGEYPLSISTRTESTYVRTSDAVEPYSHHITFGNFTQQGMNAELEIYPIHPGTEGVNVGVGVLRKFQKK